MIVDGKDIADAIIIKLQQEVQHTKTKTVCFVLLQDSPASRSFIAQKKMIAEMIGVVVEVIESICSTTEQAVGVLQDIVQKGYDGIVIQLPLATGVDVQTVLDCVPVEIDIDVLSTLAKEAFLSKKTEKKISFMPPVAGAVATILTHHGISLKGKKILIQGYGKLVGEPVSLWLTREGIAHDIVTSDTLEQEKGELLKNADIIISGVGKSHCVREDMIKDGVILIDAGTSEQAGKLVGDIDPVCAKKVSLYTPVPGGVGPVTVACLFQNLFL